MIAKKRKNVQSLKIKIDYAIKAQTRNSVGMFYVFDEKLTIKLNIDIENFYMKINFVYE